MVHEIDLKRHLPSTTRDTHIQKPPNQEQINQNSENNEPFPHNSQPINTTYDEPQPSTSNGHPLFHIQPIQSKATAPLDFLTSLYANPIIPRNVIQHVVDGVSSFVSTGISSTISDILQESSVDEQTKNRVLLFFLPI